MRRLERIFINLLLIFGYVALALPFGLDQFSRVGQNVSVQGYQQSVDILSEAEIANQFRLCEEYNAQIAAQQSESNYRFDADATLDETYLNLPNGANDIGSVIIPKINVNLPITHGTNDADLQVAAGHLYGTSLPTGGASTHSVIAAHSALRSAELFTRLDELQQGDQFYIKVLNETHVYEVDQILVVLPTECDQYMGVVLGEDYVTLYTCTPYGVNTHRLLVRGHRVADLQVEEAANEEVKLEQNVTKPVIIISLMVIIPIIVLILLNKYIIKD